MRTTNSPTPKRSAPLRIAVLGGGINGVMTAWRLATLGHQVDLFERDTLMHATSSASTKLLHGGLRYLENGELRLVHESLQERSWWVSQAPQWAHPIQLFLPIYRTSPRPRWLIKAGLVLYDLLAGRQKFGTHQWHPANTLTAQLPHLRTTGLLGAYSFYDAQMNDHALGLWAGDQARAAGVRIAEHTAVTHITRDGELVANDSITHYDRIVNITGPWAKQLLDANGIPSQHDLDLVRGSHILLPGTIPTGFLVEVPDERRICFILPYEGAILVGTTEVRQTLGDPIACSDAERAYLLNIYNSYFDDTRTDTSIIKTFAGVRPLIRSASDPSRATREYTIERAGHVITVFGGKWTTAHALAKRVAAVVEKPE